ncbi:BrnA antitoxin family protein [Xylella fastidiosa]
MWSWFGGRQDSEIFRNTGKRYQTRINAVLRSYVEAHKTDAL